MALSADVLMGLARLVIGAFFRRVEVVGRENIPETGGGVLVSWHVSGVVDPGLLVTHFPRRLIFGARHGLLEKPVFGPMMKALGTVPIYRAVDGAGLSVEERRERNLRSLDALARAVAEGSWSALFPEGETHDLPHLTEVKSGAARFYYRARALRGEGPVPVIVPVGLHYDDKRLFRSDVLIVFHPPLAVPEALDQDPTGDPDVDRERARALRDLIERTLTEVVHATDSWELHRLMHRGRSLARAERAARADIQLEPATHRERVLGLTRVWQGYEQARVSRPDEAAALLARVQEYDADLRALRLTDQDLDHPPKLVDGGLVFLLALQLGSLLLVLPPLILAGYVVNWLPTALTWALSRKLSRSPRDVATVKMAVGAIVFPLTWIGAAVAGALLVEPLNAFYPGTPDRPLLAAVFVAGLGILGGMATLRYLRLLRETLRALRVRITRSRRAATLERLRKERSELFDALGEMAVGLSLPGRVDAAGRIRPDPGEL